MDIYKSALHPDYIKKLRNAFNNQRWHAKHRDIEFKFTFDEWLDVWLASGHLHERGCRRGQYVMARFNDIGAYEIGNVRIILHADNLREGNSSSAARSATQKEAQNRPEVKAKQSASQKGRYEDPAERAKTSAAKQIKFMTPDGEFPSRGHAAQHFGIHPTTMLKWMRSKPNEFYQIE